MTAEQTGPVVDAAALGQWYVVQSNARAERHAMLRLIERGFTVHFPHYWGKVHHARQIRDERFPLFPGYLFVALQAHQALYDVEHTIGVAAVVHVASQPLEIPPRIMAAELARCYPGGLVRREALERIGLAPKRRPFNPGDYVRFAAGPFAGLQAVVEQLDKGDSLRVFVHMLGRNTAVDAVDGDLTTAQG